MLKKFLVIMAVLLLIVVSAYQLRVQLLKQGLNAALADTDIRLLQMDGFDLSWRSVAIKKLVIEQGGVQQTLRGVKLVFSTLDARLQSLTIKHAVIRFSQAGNAQAEGGQRLLLSELLQQLTGLPLESLKVDALEFPGFAAPILIQPMQFTANWHDEAVSLVLADHHSTLALDWAESGELLVLSLTRGAETLLRFRGNIRQRSGRQTLHGAGELNVTAVFPLLRPAVQLPDMPDHVAGQLLFELSGESEDELSLISVAQWQLQLLPASTLAAQLSIDDVLADVEFTFPRTAVVSVSRDASFLELKASGINWTLDEQSLPLQGKGRFSGLHCSFGLALACETRLGFELNAPRLSLPGEGSTIAINASVQGLVEITLQNDSLKAILLAGEWARADSIAQGDTHLSKPTLRAASNGTAEYRLSDKTLQLQAPELQLALPRVQLPGLSIETVLQMQQLELTRGETGPLAMTVQLSSGALKLGAPEGWLPELKLTSELRLVGPLLSLRGGLRGSETLPLLSINAHYQLDSQSGTAQLSSDALHFDAGEKRLSAYFKDWPYEWDLLAGSLDLDAALQWHTAPGGFELSAAISHQMKGLAGVYADIGFIGLSGELNAQFRSPRRLFSTRTGSITLDSLDIGVPVEALEASFQFDSRTGEVTLAGVQASVFGGRVWLEDTVLHAEQAHNRVFVGVDGVQLNQLLQLAAYDAVQATGTISGLLPLDMSKAGVTMQRGMLAAKPPGGVLRYKSEVSTDMNPALLPVMAALENFNYSVFQLEADYLENGDLELAMKFQGSNPQLQQGRPIHLNLNVTDNIPALLKSLQAGRKIADSVSRRLGGG